MNTSNTILRVASMAALALALWSLAAVRPSPSYYPLRPGMSWDYEVSNPANAGNAVQLKVSNAGRQRIGPWDAAVQKIEAAGSTGYRYAVERPDSIAMVAEQHPGQMEPTLISPPALLLRLPAQVGQTWESDATTTAVQPGTRIPVTAKVESVSDKVEVPGGVFASCLRVGSSGSVGVQLQGPDAPTMVRVDTKLWYARGVGVVQIERKESTDRPELGGAEIRYRLLGRTS